MKARTLPFPMDYEETILLPMPCDEFLFDTRQHRTQAMVSEYSVRCFLFFACCVWAREEERHPERKRRHVWWVGLVGHLTNSPAIIYHLSISSIIAIFECKIHVLLFFQIGVHEFFIRN